MRILWITMKNFKCYKNEKLPEEGVLPEGLIFIEGENSSGKSSLFDALFYALFYDPTKSRELGYKDDLIHRGEEETSVELAFEIDADYYLIRRNHSKKNPVDAALLEILGEDAEEGVATVIRKVSEGLTDVDIKLEQLFNIDREKVLKTLIVRQGEVQQLAEAKGAELRNTIYELFQLDFYKDRVGDVVKRKRERLEEEIEKNRIERTTADIEQEIQKIAENNELTEKEMKEAKIKFEQVTKELEKYPKIKDLETLKDLNNRISYAESSLQRKQANIIVEGKKLHLSVPITEGIVEQAIKKLDETIKVNERTIVKKQEEQEDHQSRIGGLSSELNKSKDRLQSLEGVTDDASKVVKCELCQQEMSEEVYIDIIRRMKQNIPILSKGIKRKKQRVMELKNEITTLQQKNRQHEITKERILNLHKKQTELENEKNEIKKLEISLQSELKLFQVSNLDDLASKYKVKEFTELYDNIQSLGKEVKSLEIEIKNKKELLKEREERNLSLLEQINKNIQKEEKRNKTQLDIAMLNQVQKHVEGFIVEDLISNRLLAAIQDATSDYIFRFTRGRYSHLYLEGTTQKTLKMSIKDEVSGFIKSQAYLSGGDKAAIGLGMRIGISDLLKRIRPLKSSPYIPPRIDILILDEPLGALDTFRREKVLEGLLADQKFSQIFLITHTNIRNDLNAPMVSVSANPRGSTIDYFPTPTELERESV